MKYLKKIIFISIFFASIFSYQSCSVIKDVTNALADIGKLTFKIDNISNMTVAGIKIFEKRSINDTRINNGERTTKQINETVKSNTLFTIMYDFFCI